MITSRSEIDSGKTVHYTNQKREKERASFYSRLFMFLTKISPAKPTKTHGSQDTIENKKNRLHTIVA